MADRTDGAALTRRPEVQTGGARRAGRRRKSWRVLFPLSLPDRVLPEWKVNA